MEKGKHNRKSFRFFGIEIPYSSVAWGIVIVLVIILITDFYFSFFQGFIPTDRFPSDSGSITKDSWLVFWGSILATLSTFILAIVTIIQNETLRKINNDREKIDAFFTTKRYMSEFYSALIPHSLHIVKEHGGWKLCIQFIDSGKIPPSTIDLHKIKVCYGRHKGSDAIDGTLLFTNEISSMNNEIKYHKIHCLVSRISLNKDILLPNGKYSLEKVSGYAIFVELQSDFQSKFVSANEIYDVETYPLLLLVIEYTIQNPVGVLIKESGDIVFSRGKIENEEPEVEKHHFDLFDNHLSVLSYDITKEFLREIDGLHS
jgi:hypothetical protein